MFKTDRISTITRNLKSNEKKTIKIEKKSFDDVKQSTNKPPKAGSLSFFTHNLYKKSQ